MIFSIIILLLVGVVAYFYYVQGFFTATISAIAAALAATMALGYFEKVTAAMFSSKYLDFGNAFSLTLIFAVTFVIIRVLFDKVVPGNIRLQATVDQVGGALMGLVVGIFAVGIFAIAAESMPFGVSILGAARFKTGPDRPVTVPGHGQATDEIVSDELISEDPLNKSPDRQTLLLPVDDWVVNFVSALSDGGSLAGDSTFASVHPALLDEYFGQRIGIQPAANHVAVNIPNHEAVSVPLAYVLSTVNEGDAEIKQLRNGALRMLKPSLASDDHNVILVIRVMFSSGATDTDRSVRFSPSSIRLVVDSTNYFPIGSLDSTGLLRVNKADDPLVVAVTDQQNGADMVFYVPKDKVLQGSADPKTGESTIKFASGAFLEVKREVRIDLGALKFVSPPAQDKSMNVLRKSGLPPAAGTTPTPAAAAPQTISPTPAVAVAPPVSDGAVPFVYDHAQVSNRLFAAVATGLLDGPEVMVQFPTGTAMVRNKTLDRLHVRPDATIRALGTGDNPFAELFVPAGKHMVQLIGTPPPTTDDAWGWSKHLGDFAIVAGSGESVKASGAAAKVLKSQQFMMAAAYQSDGPTPTVPPEADARPTDVWLMFNVANGQPLKELDYQGRIIAPLNMPG